MSTDGAPDILTGSDDGPMGRMWIEVTCGISKADSLVVRTPEDSARWDAMVIEWGNVKGTGLLAVLNIDWPGSGEPIWHGSEPSESAPPDVTDPAEAAEPKG